MIRLKNILLESKVGHLTEKPKKKAKKTGNPALDKEYTLVRKSDNSKAVSYTHLTLPTKA